ncbi:MAG TPA: BrnT family toxin [Rhizobiaceae bacterium]|nr:BrnT family toxin [Rhizobiaceae bacterium]
MFEWDERKNRINKAKHGLDFIEIERFDFDLAIVREDEDAEGERRFVATGPIGAKLCVVVYCERGANLRIISLRSAQRSERIRYVQDIGD